MTETCDVTLTVALPSVCNRLVVRGRHPDSPSRIFLKFLKSWSLFIGVERSLFTEVSCSLYVEVVAGCMYKNNSTKSVSQCFFHPNIFNGMNSLPLSQLSGNISKAKPLFLKISTIPNKSNLIRSLVFPPNYRFFVTNTYLKYLFIRTYSI